MIFANLPLELIDIIFDFSVGKCSKCHKFYNFDNLKRNCRIFEYKNVFQDEFWNKDEIMNFSSICKKCISKFSGKIIVNLKENNYTWIKDFDE